MNAKVCQERDRAGFAGSGLCWSDEIEGVVRSFARTWAAKFRLRKEDAEDLEQDAVVLAFTKIQSGGLESREGLWVLVRNCCFDFWGRMQVDSVEFEEERYPVVSMTGWERSIVEQVDEEVPGLLVLAEARAAGYSWDEISDAFGEAPGSLRVKWSRLTKRAREVFGPQLGDVLHA